MDVIILSIAWASHIFCDMHCKVQTALNLADINNALFTLKFCFSQECMMLSMQYIDQVHACIARLHSGMVVILVHALPEYDVNACEDDDLLEKNCSRPQ